jgi:hypothetical protein
MLSSKLNGMTVSAITKVPRQIMSRKTGCEALTMRSFLFQITQLAKAIEVAQTIPARARPA